MGTHLFGSPCKNQLHHLLVVIINNAEQISLLVM